MLKFFRNIRRRLLASNKFSKYLLYATGEIFLVVIGILIALQINNWNTHKQESKVLNGFIDNISHNVQSDLLELKGLKDFRDSSRVFSKNLLHYSAAPSISKEDFVKVWRWDNNAFVTKYFNPDQSGFEALKSAGYLSKLQGNPLETKLYDYNNLVSELVIEQKKLNTFLEEMSMRSVEANITQQLDNLRFHEQAYSEGFSKESPIILGLLQKPIITGANMRNGDQRVISNLYDEIIPLGEEILLICAKQLEL